MSPDQTHGRISGDLRPYLTGGAITLLALGLGLSVLPGRTQPISTLFFRADRPWLIFAIAVLLALAAVPGRRLALALMEKAAANIRATTFVIVAFVMAVAFLGTFVVCHNYALSRDEAMVGFDATIFAQGHLIAAVPAQWRSYVDALEPLFLLPVRDNAGWVSAYLPGNAAIHAVLGLVASPGLAALAVVALMGIARHLWPERPDAALVAVVLLASSTQVLVTAMTPYAMTAHLALNLVWLWLFLRDSKASHLGAVLTGVLATGLHQLVFHPLFVMPFVLSLWWTRRFRLAAFYTASYGLIVMAWVFFWQIMLHANGMEGARLTQGTDFISRVWDLLRAFDIGGVEIMLRNIARFLTWQNLLLLPLMITGLIFFRTMPRIVAFGIAGLVATLVLVFLVLPFQGHGWGYRYVHGFVGSCALLAAHGWVTLTTKVSDESRRKIASQFVAATALTVLVVLPARAYEAAQFSAPFAKAEDLIAHADSDVVFVDPNGLPYAIDLVRNDPFLQKKPFVFDLWALSDAQVSTLCASHDVVIFDKTDGERLGFVIFADRYAGSSHRDLMTKLDCGRPIRRRPGT